MARVGTKCRRGQTGRGGPLAWLIPLALGACQSVPVSPDKALVTPPPRRDPGLSSSARTPTGDEPRFIPAEAYYHFIKGRLAAEGGDCRRAVASYAQASSYDPDSAYLHSASADCLLRLGMLEQSMVEARRALRVAPGDLRASLLLARALMMARDLDGAAKVLEQLRAQKPLELSVVEMLAELRFAQGQHDAAVALVEQLARQSQTDPQPTLYLARLLLSRGEAERAAGYFERSLRIDPDQDEAWAGWVQALEGSDQIEEAARRARSWREQRPQDPAAALQEARLLARAGRRRALTRLVREAQSQGLTDERLCDLAAAIADGGEAAVALKVLRAILERSPQQERALYVSGQIHQRRGALRRAAASLARVRPESPLYASSQSALAQVRLRQGKVVGAIASLRQALALARGRDSQIELRVALAEVLARDQQFAASLQVLEPLRDQVSRSRAVLSALTQALHDNGRDDEAVALVKAELQQAPDEPGVLILLAITQHRARAYAEGEGAARQVLGLDAGNMLAQNFLAFTLAERNRSLDEALALARQAVASAPDDGYVRDTLGYVLYRRGELDEAQRELQRADRLSPDEPEILLHLGQVEKAQGRGALAVKRFRRALSLYPRDQSIRQTLQAELRADGSS